VCADDDPTMRSRARQATARPAHDSCGRAHTVAAGTQERFRVPAVSFQAPSCVAHSNEPAVFRGRLLGTSTMHRPACRPTTGIVRALYACSVWRCGNLQSDAGGDLGEDVLDVGAEHGDREDDDKGNQADHEGVFDSGRATVAAQRSHPDLHFDDAGENDFGSLHVREMTRKENSGPPPSVASGGLGGHRPIGAESGAVRPAHQHAALSAA